MLEAQVAVCGVSDNGCRLVNALVLVRVLCSVCVQGNWRFRLGGEYGCKANLNRVIIGIHRSYLQLSVSSTKRVKSSADDGLSHLRQPIV